MRGYSIVVLMLALLASAADAADEITVSPQKSAGEIVHYPRLTHFPDAQIQKRVNDLLAAHDKEESENHASCQENLRENHQKMEKDSYFTSIDVAYLSRRFLSLQVNSAWDCAGAHPGSSQQPVTIDLTTGKEVDWKSVFRPGFLTLTDSKTFQSHPGKLAALYRAHYAKLPKVDRDCLDAIHDDEFLDVVLWLDRGRRGLLANPQLPHVVLACNEDIAFSADEVATYIAAPNLLAELREMSTGTRGKN